MKKLFIVTLMIALMTGCTTRSTILNENNNSSRRTDEVSNVENVRDDGDLSERSSSSSGSKTLVAEELNKSDLGYTISKSSIYVQDPKFYFDDGLDFNGKSETKSGDAYVYNFVSSEGKDSYDSAKKYIDEIAAKCNLKITTDHCQDYTNSRFFSWGLTYTGSGNITYKGTVNFTEEEGNITVYGTVEKSRFKLAILIPTEFDIVDLGMRYSGQNVSTGLKGESISAGVYKNSDGSFSTTDGRFTVKKNEAVVFRDGDKYEGTVRVSANENRTDYITEDYYRDELFIFRVPTDRLMTGDTYTLTDMLVNFGSDFGTVAALQGFTATQYFAARHDGDLLITTNEKDNFESLSIRVMYYKKDVEIVYYVYAVFNSEPYELEAFCAADLSDIDEESESNNSGGGSVSISTGRGQDTCRNCGGSGKIDCTSCSGKGYWETTTTSPNYSGSTSFNSTITTRKDCPFCDGGRKDCPYC